MSKIITFLRTEPAMVSAAVQVALSVLIGLGLPLTRHEAGAIEAGTAALAGLAVAVAVHKFSTSALTGFLTAAGTVLAAFGVPHSDPGTVSLVNGLIVAAAALIVRLSVTPRISLPQRSPGASGHLPGTG